MPQAWGDVVPEGGRSGEPKARTGGAAGSPPGMFAPGAVGGKRALLKIKIPAASCGVFSLPQFARFRCKQRGIRPEEIKFSPAVEFSTAGGVKSFS